MDANLTCRAWMRRKGWLLLLSISPVVAVAQALVDPTRPPDELAAKARGSRETNPLQSVIISPVRRAAIIRGQTVELGEKVGDVRLIEVNESGVVLQGPKGLEVLTLFPSVRIDKKMIALPRKENAGSTDRKADE